MNRKTIIIAIVLILVAIFAFSLKNKSDDTIKIGAVFPLSGFLTSYGEAEKTATEFAISKINANGGINGKKIEVIFEDGKCSGKDALTSLKKLVEIDKVDIVLGGTCSTETLSMAPYAKREGVLMFTNVSSASQVSDYQNVFRNTINTYVSGQILADYINNSEHKRIAILTENNDYPIDAQNGVLSNLKIKPVYKSTFAYGETDFRTEITKMSVSKPDAVVILSLMGNSGHFVKQLREFGSNAQIFAVETPATPEFKTAAGKYANGIIYADIPNVESTNNDLKPLLAYFESKGIEPIANQIIGGRFDNIMALERALTSCGENNKCIDKYLKSNKFNGILGDFSFDKNGDALEIKSIMKEIKNGVSVTIKY